MRQIIGIALLRNEDLYVETALRNTIGFCDRIIVVDNGSLDGTLAIVKRMEAQHSVLQVYQSTDTKVSHDLLKPYVGSDNWILGIDGDEIYDPKGLAGLRQEIMAGGFDQWWTIFGNVVNCFAVDHRAGTATGYMAPPCRSMTKLYNFNAIAKWDGKVQQRLHGGVIEFRPGFTATKRLHLYEKYSWDKSPFRCLHMCFVPRSSQTAANAAPRPNVTEMLRGGVFEKVMRWITPAFGSRRQSSWKMQKYRRGTPVTVDATPFFGVQPDEYLPMQ